MFHFQENVPLPNNMGLAIVDCVPYVGNFLEGFIKASQQKNVPMVYLPVLQNSEHLEWFAAFWAEELIRLYQSGELQIPNFEKLLGLWGVRHAVQGWLRSHQQNTKKPSLSHRL